MIAANVFDFVQLFAAILIREEVMEDIMPHWAVSVLLVSSNAFVFVHEFVVKLISKILGFVEKTIKMPRDVWEDKCSKPGSMVGAGAIAAAKESQERDESEMDAEMLKTAKQLGYVPQRDRVKVEQFLVARANTIGLEFRLESPLNNDDGSAPGEIEMATGNVVPIFLNGPPEPFYF